MPRSYNVSEFARSQLHKAGWVEGKGLGRKEDGMPQALKVNIKADCAGVGHDPAEQFTCNWWEHAFNESSQNIKIIESVGGVAVETLDETEKLSATKRRKKDLKQKLLYGSFVKSGTLQGGKFDKEPKAVSSSDSESEKEISDNIKALTDEELLAACGGRTAHKGARHGLKLSAKLARLEAQEFAVVQPSQQLSEEPKNVIKSILKVDSEKTFKSKVKKKRKLEALSSTKCLNIDDNGLKSKKHKKRKKSSQLQS